MSFQRVNSVRRHRATTNLGYKPVRYTWWNTRADTRAAHQTKSAGPRERSPHSDRGDDGDRGGRVPGRSFFLASPESPTGKGRGGTLLQTLDTLDLPGGPASAANQEKHASTQAGGPGSAQQLAVLPCYPVSLATHRVATASSTEAIIHVTTQPYRSKAVGAVGRDPEQRGPRTGRAHAGDNFNKRAGTCELARSA